MSGFMLVILAGIIAGGFAYAIQLAVGADSWTPELLVIGLAVASLWILEKAVETVPGGVATAVWGATAAVVALAIGAIVLRESLSMPQMVSGGLIALGALGLVATSMR
jgi:quaternary ammonium compound-resistance protein SugE